jgi:uncharacterized LabA/DUF88 family protein
MIILVDYDNINAAITRLGIVHLVNRIVSRIDPMEVDSTRRIIIRLYGGWYFNNTFTHLAQALSADISLHFPNTFLLSDSTTSAIVNCEMAYSILADPTNHLFSTFRPRGMPSGLKAHNPVIHCGCKTANCPIVATHKFLLNQVCDVCNRIKPEDIFYRGEQKLVDTMLTSDLIFSANQPSNLAVVSSDDDFWPGIKTTLVNGKKVIQIHTRRRTTPSSYTQTTHMNYIQKQL